MWTIQPHFKRRMIAMGAVIGATLILSGCHSYHGRQYYGGHGEYGHGGGYYKKHQAPGYGYGAPNRKEHGRHHRRRHGGYGDD